MWSSFLKIDVNLILLIIKGMVPAAPIVAADEKFLKFDTFSTHTEIWHMSFEFEIFLRQ